MVITALSGCKDSVVLLTKIRGAFMSSRPFCDIKVTLLYCHLPLEG